MDLQVPGKAGLREQAVYDRDGQFKQGDEPERKGNEANAHYHRRVVRLIKNSGK